MKEVKEVLEMKRHEILSLARTHGVKNVQVFGSVVRGEDTPDSDIDFLVEFEENRSLFDLIRFKRELQELLGREIDVVTKNSVHLAIREQILNEAIQL